MGSTDGDVVLDQLSQAAIDLLPVAVFITTVPKGEIVRLNQPAAALWGDAPAASQPLCEYLHAGEGAPFVQATPDPIAVALAAGRRLVALGGILEWAGGGCPWTVLCEGTCRVTG